MSTAPHHPTDTPGSGDQPQEDRGAELAPRGTDPAKVTSRGPREGEDDTDEPEGS